MAYYGRDPITMKKENEYWNSLLEKERKRIHKKNIRAGPATSVYRAPKPSGGPSGRAFKPGELDETMQEFEHFYNQKNLANDPLILGKSAPEVLKKKQAKIDTRSKKLRSTKFPVTHSLKTDPTLLANRKNQKATDAEAKATTNTRDYKTTLKFKKENYFIGGKTKKRRRKKKRKTRHKKKTKRHCKKKTRKKRGGKTTVLGFPIPIFDLWQTKVKVNNTKTEVEQWKKFIEKKMKGGRRKKRTRRKKAGNAKLNSKQTFLKDTKKNEKQLKTMFKEYMNRFFITKKAITFDMVLEKIKNMKDSEFEKKINYINAVMNSSKSRSKKGGTWLPSIPSTTGDDNVDTYNCTLLAILILFAISQIAFSYMWLRGDPGLRFGLRAAIDNMRDILGPILYAVNIFCRVWVLFHNHPPQLDHLSASVRRQNNARDIMQQINHVESMIIRQRLLEEAPDSVGTFDWQAMESFLNEVRQILEEFEIRYLSNFKY